MGIKLVSSMPAVLTSAALMLTVFAPAADAQRAEQEERGASRRATPMMRESVYDRLAEAQQCTQEDDFVCAGERLEEVRAMRNLTEYEAAQMWNVYAGLHFARDDYPQAIVAFESVLEQQDLPLGVEQDALYALAQLYGQQEQYAQGLAALERWMSISEAPSADAFLLQARYHYLSGQYQEGLEPARIALRLAAEQGKQPEEGWYQLLQVLYFELEDYPNVIRTVATLAELWPKKEYFVTLAGAYGQEGQYLAQLAAYEAAYEAGWLETSSELANLAQMLLGADIPYKAARILEHGLEHEVVASTEAHWRLLAQAWMLAQEDQKVLPALTRASELSADGDLDMQLAGSHANLGRGEDCARAARSAIEKGGFERVDQAHMMLGHCLMTLQRYTEAQAAFRAATRHEGSRHAAEEWLLFAETEEARERHMQSMREAR